MKKLLTLLSMALIAICTNAQTIIGEIDWSQEESFNYWCSGDNGSTAVIGAEGLEINVPAVSSDYWSPQTVVLNVSRQPFFENSNAPAILAEDGAYSVIITAKHPAGHLMVNLGTWDDGVSVQKDFDVAEATDFEDIVVDFSEGWPADCFSNVHVLWMSGALPGLSIIKKVQIIDLNNVNIWTIAGDEALLGVDWDASYINNNMKTSDGKNYTLTKTDLTLPKGTYQYKVFKDNTTQESYPSSNASLVIGENATYTVDFTFNVATKELNASATKTDGLYFNFIKKAKVAELIQNPNNYKGTVIIPSTVTHEGEEYTVMKIADRAFSGCYGLTSVSIPNSVTSIGESVFYECGLSSVTIPNSVTYIGEGAFKGCRRLKSVYITDIESWCKIYFNGFDSNPLSYAHQLYLNGELVKSLVIPNSVTSIGNYAFYNCSGLTSVTIPNSVTSIGTDAFNGCSGLTSVTIPNSVTSIGFQAFNSCSGLTSITIPSNVTSIENGVFNGCSGLTSVTIPNSVTSVGGSAFSGCGGLTSVIIPNSVTSIGTGAFNGCCGLTSVTIPNSVTSIGSGVFCGCDGLTSVTIPNSVTSIGDYAFSGCSGLTSVTIPSSVTSIGDYAFQNCSGLSSLTIPNSVTSIEDGVFQFCSGLTSVIIPNSVTSIGYSALSGCSALTSVTIPNSVTSIEDYAFSDCSGLTSMNIPNSVTSIGGSAFLKCSGLRTLVIGKEVKKINGTAFANCDKLSDVYCSAESVPSTNSDAFKDSYIEYATLHVPSASLNNYKNAEPWKNFKNKVALSGEDIPETPKCAKPTITYNNGVITFSCETEGVEFISEVKANDNKREYNNKIILSNTYTVSVYATKTGYDNSETVTMEVIGTGGILGDLTGDGKVDVADHVKLSNIIMNK